MKVEAVWTKRLTVNKSTWDCMARATFTPLAVPSSHGLVPELAAGHVPAEEDIADGAVGLRAADVGDAEALGHFLAQRLPEEVPVLRRRGPGLGQDKNILLLVEEFGKGRGLENRVRVICEELLVAHEAGGVRAVAGNADCLEGVSEPPGPAVHQVEVSIHGLNQGGVEGLVRDVVQGVA